MKWDEDKGYIEFQTSYKSLKDLLGISELDFIMTPDIAPYITEIMMYLNRKLLMLPLDCDIKTKLDEVFDIYTYGCGYITDLNTIGLINEVGIVPSDPEGNDNIPFITDRFIMVWTNIMTSLVVRLQFQYSYILSENPIQKCPCRGQDTHDHEEWTSGVMDPDDEYEHYDYSKRNMDVIEEGIINEKYPCDNCANNYRR